MIKYEINKFPLVATILTVIGLVCAVIAIASSLLNDGFSWIASLALIEIIATVLFFKANNKKQLVIIILLVVSGMVLSALPAII